MKLKKCAQTHPGTRSSDQKEVLMITLGRRVHTNKELSKKTLKKYGDILQNGMNL
jgi:hypothetical protein